MSPQLPSIREWLTTAKLKGADSRSILPYVSEFEREYPTLDDVCRELDIQAGLDACNVKDDNIRRPLEAAWRELCRFYKNGDGSTTSSMSVASSSTPSFTPVHKMPSKLSLPSSPTVAGYIDCDIREWLQLIFESSDRFLLYTDTFQFEYSTIDDVARETDIAGGLDACKVDEKLDRKLIETAWGYLVQFRKTLDANGVKGPITLKQVRNATQVMALDAQKAVVASKAEKEKGPLDDIAELCASLDFNVRDIAPATPVKKIKTALLTGVTGFVGRVQLATLLNLKSHPNMLVYCLVRADNVDHAMSRIIDAMKEADIWDEGYRKSIVALPGNFEETNLGLSQTQHDELASKIDIVYHTGGDVNLLAAYPRLRRTNLLSLGPIIKFCTSTKLKPCHFASTLGQFPQFFACFAREFEHMSITEDSQPDQAIMTKLYPPNRIGYPWSKWGAEQVLRKAREMGLPVCIYRLPNVYIANNTGYTNKGDYAAALTVSSLLEGIFPIGSATAPFTPVDTICEMLVDCSLLQTRKHWIYNLIDCSIATSAQMTAWAELLGISYRGVDVETFLKAVKERGPDTPVFKFMPLMQHWRPYWFDGDERTLPFPIRTQNIFDDLPNARWPDLQSSFEASILYMIKRRFFKDKSMALNLSTERALDSATRRFCEQPSNDKHDPSDDPSIKTCLAGAKVLVQSLLDEARLSFAGKLLAFRRTRQALVNLMALASNESIAPSIKDITIKKPIFVMGMSTLATGLVQRLLDQDKELRAVRYYEATLPYGEDGKLDVKAIRTSKTDPRFPPACLLLKAETLGVEGLGDSPLVAPDMPVDDSYLFDLTGKSLNSSIPYNCPRYVRWVMDQADWADSYSVHKRFLRHLAYQKDMSKGNVRFVCLMAWHMLSLEDLFKAYPDATVIIEHSDPSTSIAALCGLAKTLRDRSSSDASLYSIGDHVLAMAKAMTQTMVSFRASHPELASQVHDVQSEELASDPVGCMRRLYRAMGMSLGRQTQDGMWSVAKQLEKYRYDLTSSDVDIGDYGLSSDQIEQALASYIGSGMYKPGAGNTIATQAGKLRSILRI